MAIAEIKKQGTTLNVRPEGQIDTASTPLLDMELQPHLEGVRDIVMDFSEVGYITSSGLRLLMWLDQKMEKNGGEVQVVHVNDSVMEIFELTGFTEIVHVIAD